MKRRRSAAEIATSWLCIQVALQMPQSMHLQSINELKSSSPLPPEDAGDSVHEPSVARHSIAPPLALLIYNAYSILRSHNKHMFLSSPAPPAMSQKKGKKERERKSSSQHIFLASHVAGGFAKALRDAGSPLVLDARSGSPQRSRSSLESMRAFLGLETWMPLTSTRTTSFCFSFQRCLGSFISE